jgi:Fur family peroxide stress response transcriptional regulator
MMSRDDAVLVSGFKRKCRVNSLKITPQRTAIYRELMKSKDHPSASEVFSRVRGIFPDISFDTVNRTLLSLSEIGVVTVVEGYGEPKRFDPETESHHHFRCLKCNSIIDIHHKSLDNIKIPADIGKRFTVLNKKVVIEGICEKCRRRHG